MTDPTLKAAAVAMRLDGASTYKIATELGIGRNKVLRLVKDVPNPKSTVLTNDQIADLRKRFTQGESKETLSQAFKIFIPQMMSYIDDRSKTERARRVEQRRLELLSRRTKGENIPPSERAEIVRRRLEGESFSYIARTMKHGFKPCVAVFFQERPDLTEDDLPRTASSTTRISDAALSAEVALRFERGDDIDDISKVLGVSVDDIRVVGSTGNRRFIRQRNVKAMREIQLQSFIAHNGDIADVAYQMLQSGMSRNQIIHELGVYSKAIFRMIDIKEKEHLTNR